MPNKIKDLIVSKEVFRELQDYVYWVGYSVGGIKFVKEIKIIQKLLENTNPINTFMIGIYKNCIKIEKVKNGLTIKRLNYSEVEDFIQVRYLEKLWDIYEENLHPLRIRGTRKAIDYFTNINYEDLYKVCYKEDKMELLESFEIDVNEYRDNELESLLINNYDGVDWSDWYSPIIETRNEGIFIAYDYGIREIERYDKLKEKGLNDIALYLRSYDGKKEYWGDVYLVTKIDVKKFKNNIDKLIKQQEDRSYENIPF